MTYYLTKPKFKQGVQFLIGDKTSVFSYGDVSFDIDCNEAAAQQLERLCDNLTLGFEMERIGEKFPEFKDHAVEIIKTLDRFGFTVEAAHVDVSQSISGKLFWEQIESASFRVKEKLNPKFYAYLKSENVTRDALIAYVIEYLHVVKAGPKIIAAALPHARHPNVENIMTRFFKSELGHEKMILDSLSAVGITEEMVSQELPSAEVFSLISTYQVLAAQDFLSFISLVFLLEDPADEFHAAFVDACRRVGMPEGFWKPIVQHAEINDDGDHGSISKELLFYVDALSFEEKNNVLKHLVNVLENIVALENRIMAAGTTAR